jgi:AcrR family transcriptional regulator
MKNNEIASETRSRILDAATQVIIEKGGMALTLDAVARQAGVSKGGLLYHFPSKDSLIVGMIEQLIAGFNTSLDQELADHPGNWLAAYIRASFSADPEHEKITCALVAALANNPRLLAPVQRQYEEWQSKAAASAPQDELGTIVRLAIDGLWFGELLGFAPPDPEQRRRLQRSLLALAEEPV